MMQTTMHNDENAIAIIGYWCRVAGANSPHEFHDILRTGNSTIRELNDDELDTAGVSVTTRRHPDYRPFRAVLDDAAMFDNKFYRTPPAEARLTDPQHRQFLEIADLALEHAGIDCKNTPLVGVFATQSQSEYANAFTNIEEGSIKRFSLDIFNSNSHLASNVAYRLGCEGPAITLQAACSGSLACVHLACQSLLAGDCEVALAGGISIGWPQYRGYMYVPGSIMSENGACSPFSQSACGTVRGEGGGAVVLCRLKDYIEGRITGVLHGIIKGSAINNDGGKRMGFTTPSAHGQSKVILKALSNARVQPGDVTNIEAHGTGTQVGDAIELSSLASVFSKRSEASLWLGSVKANIGHLDAGAGVVGLIKMVLALQHKVIYPMKQFIHFSTECKPHANIFRISNELQPWESEKKRIGGVSSFGLGGSNAHIIVEEGTAGPESITGIGPYKERQPLSFTP